MTINHHPRTIFNGIIFTFTILQSQDHGQVVISKFYTIVMSSNLMGCCIFRIVRIISNNIVRVLSFLAEDLDMLHPTLTLTLLFQFYQMHL